MSQATLWDRPPAQQAPEQARAWVEAGTATPLTPAERAILNQAEQDGYYVQTGRRLAVLLAWQRWCRANGKPAIVVAIAKTFATVSRDAVEAWRGKPDEAHAAAQRIAGSTPARFGPRQADPWTTTTLDRPLPGGGHPGGVAFLGPHRHDRVAHVQKTRTAQTTPTSESRDR